MLLDTCVIQNIEWVWKRMEENIAHDMEWTEERVAQLEVRFGPALANELLDLGTLVSRFEWESSFPWLVSSSARKEFEQVAGRKGPGLISGWKHLSELQDDWCSDAFNGASPGILVPTPTTRVNPLILHGLDVASVGEIVADGGPLDSFSDPGDRALIRDALLSGVPAILTTDLRTFWSKRAALYDYGLEVWRPSDVLTTYIPKWAEQERMLARRRAAQDARRSSSRPQNATQVGLRN
jgi:hypothetical protein